MKTSLLLCLFIFCTVSLRSNTEETSIWLNEVMSSNGSTLADEDGDYSDWIELYNAGESSIDLSAWGLSDRISDTLKWRFPDDSVLEAGAYLVVWTSGKDRTETVLHTNFSLSSSGEELYLSLPDGSIVDTVEATRLPPDVTLGRNTQEDATWLFYDEPTPGVANTTTAYTGILKPPIFSLPAGFYITPQTLSLSVPEGVMILYSTDGSEPTQETVGGKSYQYKNQYPRDKGASVGPLLEEHVASYSYSEPITIVDRSTAPLEIGKINTRFTSSVATPTENVRKGTVIRAKAVQEGKLPSPIATQTYFMSSDFSAFNDFIILSVTADERDLFSYDDGIYIPGKIADDWRLSNPQTSWDPGKPANYTQSGETTEKPAHLEVFSADGTLELSQAMGIRLHGGWSRGNRIKSLRLYARAAYGTESFDFPFFPHLKKAASVNEPLEKFESLVLRNSGGFNDWEFTYFRDALAQTLIEPLDLDSQAYRPAVHFINGEYWGLINVRERQDQKYLESHYDVAQEDIAILESSWITGLSVDEGLASDLDQFLEIVNFSENNPMDETENYEWVQERVDTDNLATYYAVQIYLNNKDWPDNNNDLWRKRTVGYEAEAQIGHDGRWRWLLYDTDFGMGGWNFPRTGRPLARVVHLDGTFRMFGVTNSPVNKLFRALVLNNTDFKNTFINTMADQLNSVFTEERVIATLNAFEAKIAPFWVEHNQRWGTNLRTDPKMRAHAITWPTSQRTQIIDEFLLTGSSSLTLNTSNEAHGQIRINSLTINSITPGLEDSLAPYPWSGIYFDGVPVELEALPTEGYQFMAWEGKSETAGTLETLSTEPIFDFMPNGNYEIKAIFEPIALEDQRFTLHEWNFDGAEAPWHPSFTIGSGVLSIENENSSAEFETGTGKGFDSEHFRINDPLGAAVIFNLPTRGFQQINLNWLTRRSSNGAGLLSIWYSIGGSMWQPLASITTFDSIPQTHSIDLEQIPGVENNYDFRLRFEFSEGDGGTGGNNRFDAIQLTGVALAPTAADAHPYSQWVTENFLEAEVNDPTISGLQATPADDSVANLIKYALGIQPDQSVTLDQFVHSIDDDGDFYIRFYLDNRKVDITYYIDASKDLDTWDDVLFDSLVETPFPQGLAGIHEITVKVEESERLFLRLRVQQR